MKYLLKLFFFYCAGFAILISLINLKNLTPASLAATLIFFPVSLYFSIALVKNLLHHALLDPNALPTFNGFLPQQKDLIITLLVFMGLLSLGVNNILSGNTVTISSDPAQDNHNQKSATASASLIINSPQLGFATVRSEATTSASIITQVKDGSKFSVLNTDKDWYQVQLSSDQSGWIHANLITTQP